MEDVKFTSYPEGFMKAAENLDFIEEDMREGFMWGVVFMALGENP